MRTSVQPSPVPSSGIHTAPSAEHAGDPRSPQYGAPRPLTILRTGHRDPHGPQYRAQGTPDGSAPRYRDPELRPPAAPRSAPRRLGSPRSVPDHRPRSPSARFPARELRAAELQSSVPVFQPAPPAALRVPDPPGGPALRFPRIPRRLRAQRSTAPHSLASPRSTAPRRRQTSCRSRAGPSPRVGAGSRASRSPVAKSRFIPFCSRRSQPHRSGGRRPSRLEPSGTERNRSRAARAGSPEHTAPQRRAQRLRAPAPPAAAQPPRAGPGRAEGGGGAGRRGAGRRGAARDGTERDAPPCTARGAALGSHPPSPPRPQSGSGRSGAVVATAPVRFWIALRRPP